ncbi:MAG: hypothetical protein K2K21_03270 [Lachnospiraceae bacterium]|nr:hypothetical protein [Lachnospiraceae bacterium]
MKRIMMAGALVVMMILMYWYAQSGVTYPKATVDTLGLGEKKSDIVKKLSDQCIELWITLHEAEESVYDTQFSLQETPDGYEVILYDREGREIYSEWYPKEPWVKEVAEGILEIGISVGSPARYTFYFRKEDGKISDTFFNARVVGEKYIAHRPLVGDHWYNAPLILTDIFEEGILYQEIYKDFSVTADLMSAIYSIELIDEDHIMLEYCTGEDYSVVNEVVEIENTK